jgi:hypothetical protein
MGGWSEAGDDLGSMDGVWWLAAPLAPSEPSWLLDLESPWLMIGLYPIER